MQIQLQKEPQDLQKQTVKTKLPSPLSENKISGEKLPGQFLKNHLIQEKAPIKPEFIDSQNFAEKKTEEKTGEIPLEKLDSSQKESIVLAMSFKTSEIRNQPPVQKANLLSNLLKANDYKPMLSSGQFEAAQLQPQPADPLKKEDSFINLQDETELSKALFPPLSQQEVKIFEESRFVSSIKISAVEQNSKLQTLYAYKISGTFLEPDDITSRKITRRYSEFRILHLLISHDFYFKVLPSLPEKNVLYKIKASHEMAEERARALQTYISKLVLLRDLMFFEPLRLFLLDQEGFAVYAKKPEVALALGSDSLFSKAKEKLSGLLEKIRKKQDFGSQGFYSVFEKEVDSLYLIIKKMLEDYQKLNESVRKICQDLDQLQCLSLQTHKKHLKEIPENPHALSKALNLPVGAKRTVIEKLILVLSRLFEDVLGCKEALERKNKIYKDYSRILNELQTKNNNSNLEDSLKIAKAKVDKLEECLKPELTLHIRIVKHQLEIILDECIQNVFAELFKTED